MYTIAISTVLALLIGCEEEGLSGDLLAPFAPLVLVSPVSLV